MIRSLAKTIPFIRLLACVPGLFLYTECTAGTYIFAGETYGVNLVLHPTGYNGQGGTLTIRVCIDPNSANASAMEIPVQNNINVYNRLQPTTGNLVSGGNNDIANNQYDFESVALHELGHCIGMAHVNAASESGLSGGNQNYTKATNGSNNQFDINPGTDGLIGSSDDIRGDDVNLHWYRKSNNNPFTIDNPVDSSTYVRDLTDLQLLGHSFATNADRTVAANMGFPNTEAVMQQLTYNDEAQRALTHDDVATLRYAASGKNENAGTSDDYTINLEYGGISSSSSCNITLDFDNGQTGFATCYVSGSSLPGSSSHWKIASANIYFNTGFNWFFNPDTVNQAPALSTIGNLTLTENQSLNLVLSASDADNDNLAFSSIGLPSFVNLVDLNNGTATLDITPTLGDFGIYPVTVAVTDDGLPPLIHQEAFNITVDELDSDGDGLGDYVEINTYLTNPNNPDSDGDFINDGDEINNASDPLDPLSWPNFADGDIAPLGAPDGLINAADHLIAQRIVLGLVTATSLELAHGDIYPTGTPDGVINISDLILILKLIEATL